MEPADQKLDKIVLSPYTKALFENLKKNKRKPLPDESSRISVSQTVSFFAIAYEKLRNAVEYRENHLIRRAAIERILKRRLALNPGGEGEAENLIRELLWARYFPNESLGTVDISNTQEIINKYLTLRSLLLVGQTEQNKKDYSQFLFDLMTCEIEESLSPYEARQSSLFTFYIYQVLKDKVKIENVDDEQKNTYFYVALEKGFNKSDSPYLRYHLFTLSKERISLLSEEQIKKLVSGLPDLFRKINSLIRNPNTEKLRRFIKKQIPPFKLFFDLFKAKGLETEEILQDKNILWTHIEQIAREKYAQTGARLRNLAIKAIIYIFITKAIFALILEYPLSIYFYNQAHIFSLIINTIFPPALMFIFIGLTRVPGGDNTKRLFQRIKNIVDADKSFEKTISFISKRTRVRRPLLIFSFTIFYAMTFFITFTLLYELLSLLNFNLVSQAVFVFFVSLVTFFAYRIMQIAKEYQLKEKEGFFQPFGDFFFMPILSVGRILSRGIAKLNFFGAFFDFLIEAPFKFLIEVVEEWISFVRSKREEID